MKCIQLNEIIEGNYYLIFTLEDNGHYISIGKAKMHTGEFEKDIYWVLDDAMPCMELSFNTSGITINHENYIDGYDLTGTHDTYFELTADEIINNIVLEII